MKIPKYQTPTGSIRYSRTMTPENLSKAANKAGEGGKMNIIEFLKNGSGIHIKPENKGKFTKYCNGKVTSECIARGKRSSDPAVRKRATFAANARKWKHLNGGLIVKAQEGTKTNFWLKAGNFLNSDTGKTLINGVSQLYNGIKNSSKASDFRLLDNERIKAGKEAIINNVGDVSQEALHYINYLLQTNPNNHYGTIDLLQTQQRLINLRRLLNKVKADLWELELLDKQNDTILSIQGSGSNDIFSILGNVKDIVGLFGKKLQYSNAYNIRNNAEKDLAGTSFITPDKNNSIVKSNVISGATVDDFRNIFL